jgi:hypothetical protein
MAPWLVYYCQGFINDIVASDEMCLITPCSLINAFVHNTACVMHLELWMQYINIYLAIICLIQYIITK